MNGNIPRGWGEDSLSEFIVDAHHNVLASYVQFRGPYARLRDIDKAYRTLVEHLFNTPDWPSAWFLLGAHSSFLGGARLALSGQTAEAFRVLRGCVENSLYGFYVYRHPESFDVWARRHDDEESLKAVRKKFSIGNVRRELERFDEKLGQVTKMLYERSIDFGGHPNERAFTSSMKIIEKGARVSMELRYLTGNRTQLMHCIKANAQIGVCSLSIFRHVFLHRFDLIGLTQTLDKLKSGL